MANLSVLYIIIAGIMNAAFIVPTKFLKNFSYEQAWFYFGIFGSMILPWVFLLIYSPTTIINYTLINHKIILLILAGGFVFGVGQSYFSFAVKYIGIARSFAINLSVGAIVGSFAVIIMNHVFFTKKGLWTCIALLLVILGLIFYYFSEPTKKSSDKNDTSNAVYKGWILSTIAGVTSGLQNMIFVYVTFHTSAEIIMRNTFWIWPLFLLTAGISMSIQFWRAYNKNNPDKNIFIFKPTTDLLMIILMGLCSSGSLVVYSYTMGLLSNEEQIIGWPFFMVSIILSTQFFGKIFDNSQANTFRAKSFRIAGVGLLILSIIFLSI